MKCNGSAPKYKSKSTIAHSTHWCTREFISWQGDRINFQKEAQKLTWSGCMPTTIEHARSKSPTDITPLVASTPSLSFNRALPSPKSGSRMMRLKPAKPASVASTDNAVVSLPLWVVKCDSLDTAGCGASGSSSTDDIP